MHALQGSKLVIIREFNSPASISHSKLYGNDVSSFFKLVKGFTRQVTLGSPVKLPSDIKEAHKELIARRKLNSILRSNAVRDPHIQIGDMINISVKRDNQKRGNWSHAKPVLKYDVESRTVTVPGSNGKFIQAAA